METGLLHAHSGLRYVVFLLLIIVTVKAVMAVAGGKKWTKTDVNLTKFLLITTHIQLVLGLILYFFVLNYYKLFQNMGDTMSNPDLRWKAVEHLVGMLIFVALVTIMHSKTKKESTKNRPRKALLFSLLAFVVGFLSIPIDRWF